MKIELFNSQANRAHTFRDAGPAELAEALIAGRRALLGLVGAYRAALGDDMRVLHSPELNLPLWELGHIGWFEEYWIARNPHWAEGLGVAQAAIAADRAPSQLANADGLYDSSHVAHATRWQLTLPRLTETDAYLSAVRCNTLDKLQRLVDGEIEASDDALYFFRLVLFHEAMHLEAWIYMAQTLGFDVGVAVGQATTNVSLGTLPTDGSLLQVDGGVWQLGLAGSGFAFDNELGAHQVSVADFQIARNPVSWRDFIAFIDADGYRELRCWSAQGREWLERCKPKLPRYLRRVDDVWQRQQFGVWRDLPLDSPAMNLTLYEAQAWCDWAGRRLPSEAEWEMAACTADADFNWGEVWEWTASSFAPYPGFTPHPYRDYSAPWFDGRPVLRGASFATSPSMGHPRYRNFFTAERNDVFAGFRSCAVQG